MTELSHKERTRQRIVKSAANAFRAKGYDGVSIDQLMAAADLTRGGFYAHFASKEALFSEVLLLDHPLLRKLEERDGVSSSELWAQMLSIFQDYLTPAHLSEVSNGCTLASLSTDTARGSDAGKAAYARALERIVAEMARGQREKPNLPSLLTALSLAVGAVTLAAATASKEQQKAILDAARQSFLPLVSTHPS